MSGTTRNVVSLDSSSSSSSDDSMILAVAPASLFLGASQLSYTHIFNDQLRLRRELDYMFVQVDDMHAKLDAMTAEVAVLKRFRCEVEAKLAQKCSL